MMTVHPTDFAYFSRSLPAKPSELRSKINIHREIIPDFHIRPAYWAKAAVSLSKFPDLFCFETEMFGRAASTPRRNLKEALHYYLHTISSVFQ